MKQTPKVELYQHKIAVTKEDLTRDDDGPAVITLSNYDNLIKRDKLTVLRPGKGLGCYALIEYASMPDRFRARFVEKYGDPEELLCRHETPAVTISDEARSYYAAQLRPDGEPFTSDQVEQYTINASVLDHLIRLRDGQAQGRKEGGSRTPICWEAIHRTSEMLRRELRHTLPRRLEPLKNKIRAYDNEGYDILVSRKVMNNNSRKIGEEGGRYLVALRRSKTPVYTLQTMLKAYNIRAKECGWEPLKSTATIKAYLSRPEIEPLWYSEVYGEQAARQRFDRKQRTLMPQMRDALWYGDGTKLNLYYKGFDKNGKPALRTLMVYEVIDAFSEMLLGYCISKTENADMQRRAFRMAVETAGCKPYEIVTDNQGGQKNDTAKAFMNRLCRVRRFTAPFTPQAKSIEQVFGRFQSQVLLQDWAYTGSNVTAVRKDLKAKREHIAANFDGVYTYEELCEAYAAYREVWNDMPHPRTKVSRRIMYRDSANAEAVQLSELDFIELFWEETKQTSTYTSSGIEIQVDGQTYAYEVLDENGMPDYAFNSRSIGRQFYVRYDRDDMTKVWLYEETHCGKRRVRSAAPYVMVHRALQEQDAAEQDFLRATIEANKQARILRQQQGYEIEAEFGMAPEQNGLRTPKLAGISKRDQERISDRMIAEGTFDVPIIDHAEEEDCEPVGIGEFEKHISNQVSTFNMM